MQSTFSNQVDKKLFESLTKILRDLEKAEMIVCVTDTENLARKIMEELQLPQLKVTNEELAGLRSLVFHAVNDKSFFDWEMPTLTGFTSSEFENIIKKLPKLQ